jgi:thymidylate synthase
MYILDNFDDNLRKVLDHGYDMMDRTGVGCRYLPGITTEIDISQRVPVPTRRKTAWKSMLKEYLWFLTGSDNINDLRAMGSKVWDSWDDPEWAKKNGFKEGSIGYGYGPNLIRYGADINNPEDKGFNQLDYVINELKTNPNSRRILFSFYRPDKQGSSNVKIDTCHHTYQFIVEPNKKLSCVMFQRSNDAFIGNLSTNLQGAAFYTYMIAQQTGFTPSKLIHCGAHFHIYNNHFEAVREYLERDKPNSPILILNKRDSIYDYTSDDFTLEDYNPLPSMKLEIAV